MNPAVAPRTLSQAVAFGHVAGEYQRLRARFPAARAITIARYIRDDHGLTFPQFECETEVGHCWPRELEERDRCLCSNCGADGDA